MTITRQPETPDEKTLASQPVLPQKTSSTKIFEDLAKSRSVFHNIGLIKTTTKLPGGKIKYCEGSGIYIGNQIIITVAHALPHEMKNGEFLSITNPQTHFYLEANDGVSQKARVIMAYRHPNYVMSSITFKFNSFIRKNFKNDIAILLLDREFKNLDPIVLNFTPRRVEHDVTAVGFSRYMTPLPTNHKRTTWNDGEIKHVGVKAHEIYYDKNIKLFVNKIGCSIKSEKCFFGRESQENTFDPLEAGTYPGMSGGGNFNENSVFSVICGGWQTSDYESRKIKDDDAHILSDECYSVPFFNHKSWIEKIITLYKTQLPYLMNLNKQWQNVNDNNHHENTEKTNVLKSYK